MKCNGGTRTKRKEKRNPDKGVTRERKEDEEWGRRNGERTQLGGNKEEKQKTMNVPKRTRKRNREEGQRRKTTGTKEGIMTNGIPIPLFLVPFSLLSLSCYCFLCFPFLVSSSVPLFLSSTFLFPLSFLHYVTCLRSPVSTSPRSYFPLGDACRNPNLTIWQFRTLWYKAMGTSLLLVSQIPQIPQNIQKHPKILRNTTKYNNMKYTTANIR